MDISYKAKWDFAFGIFGTKPPTAEEVAHAQSIMDAVPSGLSPIDVARHLMALSDRNADGELYIAEWKTRSNPLIVGFFAATNYDFDDVTDQTKWCAAFVNWCRMRAGLPHTNSASSGSFRCFGDAAATPAAGDIAVFKNAGQDEKCKGSGHVAFWTGAHGQMVTVLGGNQKNQIKLSDYRASTSAPGSGPTLVSVRKS